MQITVVAVGTLPDSVVGKRELTVSEGATVGHVLDLLGLTWGEVGIIAVNGQLRDEQTVLRDGDRVEFIAPMGGGDAGRSTLLPAAIRLVQAGAGTGTQIHGR